MSAGGAIVFDSTKLSSLLTANNNVGGKGGPLVFLLFFSWKKGRAKPY